MSLKSERLKKLETELQDLEQWLKLGLVPKKDLDKHKEEILSLKGKISDERERLRQLKESGEVEEFVIPKKPQNARQAYQEPHSMPEMEAADEGLTDAGFDMESESFDVETGATEEHEEGGEETGGAEEEEEDPFSDKNRWRRGVIEDPDQNSW
jgi:hypothetical protein